MTVNEQISKDVTTDLCYYVVGLRTCTGVNQSLK